MPSRDSLKVDFFIAWKKVLAARIHYVLLSGFVVLLGYIWLKDSFSLSLRAFLYLFPYVFLFASQDMVKDEVDSGALENVLFLNGNFRGYLLGKSIFLAAAAFLCSLAMFLILAAYALVTRQFFAVYLLQFLAGVAAGIYYLSLGGLLSFSFKGGSNVLIVILGQVFLFIGLLLSAAKRGGFIDSLENASFPDLSSRLKFFVLAAVFPNAVVAKKFIVYALGIAACSLVFFFLQRMKIRDFELERK
jgi:hypothetical protein